MDGDGAPRRSPCHGCVKRASRSARLEGRDVEEARDLARQAVADGVESLVVVGGDGMVHLAVNELVHTDTSLGIIPAGTGNDAARYFGIPRKDPQAAADVVVAGHVRTVDVGRVGPHHFLCVLSAGFDAVVNERANHMRWPTGQMRYNLATLAELRVFEPLRYTLDLDGETRQVEAMLVAVGNGPSFGGGLRITEGAELDDGLLDVVLFHPVSKLELLRTYPKLFSGTHTDPPGLRAPPGPAGHGGLPGHRGLRRRGTDRAAAPHRRRRCPGRSRCWPGRSPHEHALRALREVPCRAEGAGARRLPRALRLPARRLPGACLRGRRGRRQRAGRGARPGRARRSWGSSRSTSRSTRAASASTPPRSRRCRTRSTPTWCAATGRTRSVC